MTSAILNVPLEVGVRVSAVICSDPAPVFVMVTVLLPAPLANVSVRTPNTVDNVPGDVADENVNVPGVTPVPDNPTGEPVTVAPV